MNDWTPTVLPQPPPDRPQVYDVIRPAGIAANVNA
jgi:hypothetical protein